MKKNFLISLFIFFIISSCNCNLFNNDNLGNTPLEIPDYVLYGMLYTYKDGCYITVIDMERDSIVGYYRVSKGDEKIEDFCIGNGNFYVTISFTDMFNPFGPTGGNNIRIIDSELGKETGIIETVGTPSSIFSLPNNEAFVFHYFTESGDTGFVNSIVDLDKKTVIKKIICSLGRPTFQEIFDSPDNDIWIFADSPHSDNTYIIKFVAEADTLGERVLLEQEFNGMTLEPYFTKFITEDKIYATCCYPNNGIIVYDFPSGKVEKFISLVNSPTDILCLPNGKVYTSYYDYSCLDGSDNTITVIDANSDAIIKTINVCPGPFYMAYSETMNKVYVGSAHKNCISVIDPTTDSLIETMEGEAFGTDRNLYTRLITNR